MIVPGRFIITGTTIDNPDLIRFELRVLTTLNTYCARPDGKYPTPADLLTLGRPDSPVKNIEVQTRVETQ